jgi:tetratricopeptide (TPR) repeat protein
MNLKTNFIGGLILAVLITGCSKKESEKFNAPLFTNLGTYRLDITTQSESALKFFNQGLIMANAFNHLEASRSFAEAVRQDSTCAMAYWGVAYVLGPNYNSASNMGELEEIRSAVKHAVQYSEAVAPWEKLLIKAIATKFPLDSAYTNAEAYSESMRKAHEQFPKNDLIATLFAESIMNLHAWDLYTTKGGKPKPWTPELVEVLEKALVINPNNPLANHLYIHAVEAAADVEKGLESANRLKTLVPGAGHLVHMPSHIYINTGHYYEGSLANEEAVKCDSIYIAECNVKGVYPQLYYPHNYHFLAATATLEGRGARAIEAAFKMVEIIDKKFLKQPGFETTQHYITIPYNVLVKFAQWEKILVMPKPDTSLYYPTAIWHYARGMAYANTNKVGLAKVELRMLETLANTDEVKNMLIWELNHTSDVAQMAIYTLQAEIERKEGSIEKAARFLRDAVMLEDALTYTEPPDWFFSVRHMLGDVYMEAGEYALAEQAYREDLKRFPNNGFALHGLFHSLVSLGKIEEADIVKENFEAAWLRADSQLQYAGIDPHQRKDLAIRLVESTPNSLMYIAGTFCSPKK